jgi:hypothetical protein
MEFIKANDTTYKCQKINTGKNNISLVMEGEEIAGIAESFKKVTSLEVFGDDGKVYGQFEHLDFVSATLYKDETIQVMLHIKTDLEIQIENLEETQAEQDEAIAELYGGNLDE